MGRRARRARLARRSSLSRVRRTGLRRHQRSGSMSMLESALPRENAENVLVSQVVEPAPTGALVVAPLPSADAGLGLSLIVPTYNESENVRNLVAALSELLDARFGLDYEIILVDDDSPDKTWEIAAGLVPEFPRLRVIRRQNERGLSG